MANLKQQFKDGELNSAIGAGSALIGQGISGGLSSGVGNALSGLGNVASAIPGPMGAIASAGLNIVGGIYNKMFGSDIDEAAVENYRAANIAQSNKTFTAGDNASLLSQANFDMLGDLKKSDIGKDGIFSNKAANITRELNHQRQLANSQAINSFANTVENSNRNNNLGLLQNYAAFGGPQNTIDGFNNGLVYINEGGSHEQNPYGGIQNGVDQNGIPNTVEEGEVVATDILPVKYAFSNRIYTPNRVNKKYNLKGKNTYAEAVKKLTKESNERPNDPISKNGVKAVVADLAQNQEQDRMKYIIKNYKKNKAKEALTEEEVPNMYAGGGNEEEGYLPEDMYLGTPFSTGYNNYSPSTGFTYNPNYLQATTGPTGGYVENLQNPRPSISGNIIGPDASTLKRVPDERRTYENPPQKDYKTWMRYAPIVGSAFSTIHSYLENPDYSTMDRTEEALNNVNDVDFTPLIDYLTYNPFDRNYYLNNLNTQAAATRRAIVNNGGGNRAAVANAILASNFNTQGKIGELARQAEEYNLNERKGVAEFNRATRQYNSEKALAAAMANQNAAFKRVEFINQIGALRAAEKNRISANRSANFTNLFNNLGALGSENLAMNQAKYNRSTKYSATKSGKSEYKVPSVYDLDI